MTRQQLTVNVISILLCIFRFFKYYEFQPRLQIVNQTMGFSMVHLYHFCIIFFIIFTGFAFAAHINFGSSVRDFSTLGHSMQALWESLLGNYDLGPTIGNGNMSYINPSMGVIFFISWIFVAAMVLMNVFVAILMDSYAMAKEEGQENAAKIGKDSPDAVSDDIVTFLGQLASMFSATQWKYSKTTLLHALQKLDESKPNPGYNKKRMLSELEALEKQRENIDKRIEYLKHMTNYDMDEEAFHVNWNKKYVTFEELALVVPFVNEKLKDHLDVAEMEATWDESVRYVPEEEDQGDPNLVSTTDNVAAQVQKLKAYIALINQQNNKMKEQLNSVGR